MRLLPSRALTRLRDKKPGSFADSEVVTERKTLAATLAISFVFSVLYQLPNWPELYRSIYGYPMIDRAVYEEMILSYNLPVDYIFYFNPVEIFTRELLWNSSLAYLNRDLGIPPATIFAIISTLVLWRFSFDLVGRAGWLYLVLLINPLVVDFAFSQLRLACAIATVSFFWRNQRGWLVTIAAFVVGASIHTAIVLFGVMMMAALVLKKSTNANVALLVLTGFVVSIVIGPLQGVILGALEDRRVDYQDMSSTILYLVFWIFMWVVLILRPFESMKMLEGRYSLVILSVVLLNLVTGGYSTRFLAAAFPYLIVTVSGFRMWGMNPLLLAFGPYAVMQWAYWAKLGI